MNTLAEICSDAVAFTYRSIDRLILNVYIPTLQTPGAMAYFLREVCHKPILSGHVFKWLTERFVTAVQDVAREQRVPVLRARGQTKPGELGQRQLQAAARANRWGLIAIVVHQESARVFASYHAGGRPTNFWVKEDRRLVSHYYFYLRDREYGEGFVRISSYPPFQTRIWLNAQRWLAWVPDPLTPAERAAGYPSRLSIYQVEFSDNVIFHQTQVLNRVYEQLLREHLHLGRPDMLKVVFDRQIRKTTPGVFTTRLLRQGVVSCLKVFYKRSWLKQYNKGGRVLRTEVCINDPRDFNIGKSLVHLGYLGTIAYHAITRFQKAQAVAMATALDRSTFERLITPSTDGGQRVAGLRFGAPRTMRVLEALGCTGLTFKAFSHTDLRAVLVERLGAEAADVTPARLAYELRKLRGKGVLRKVPRRNLYTLTDVGYRSVIYLTKL